MFCLQKKDIQIFGQNDIYFVKYCLLLTFESNYRVLRTQSFTSLKADICQDINGGFEFGGDWWCLNGTFP